MPLFSYPTAPYVLGSDGAIISGTSTGIAVTAGSAYLAYVTLSAPITVTQMRCGFSGSPTGNVDMGVYDASGANSAPNNLLGHTGANVAATGLFTKSLTANLTLAPGQYWIAFMDTVADSAYARGFGVTGLGPVVKTTATNLTVLPSTIGATADTATFVSCIGLLLNGWT
jgi:hypothetical protein